MLTSTTYPFAMAKGDRETTVSPQLLVRWLETQGAGAQARFARELGATDQVVNNWKERGIPKGRLVEVCGVMGITVEQYMSDPKGTKFSVPHRLGVSQIVNYDRHTSDLPATFSIPLLNTGGVMGVRGRVQPELETIVGTIDINQRWVRAHLPNLSSPNNLRCITGFGDSMADTYQDGDILFVDTAVQEIKLDAVYVFSLNKELFIKRLQRRPDGALVVLSDNKHYDPYVIEKPEKADIAVVGRVVWAWNGRKL